MHVSSTCFISWLLAQTSEFSELHPDGFCFNALDLSVISPLFKYLHLMEEIETSLLPFPIFGLKH